MKKIILCGLLLAIALGLFVVLLPVKPTAAAPCEPCNNTWTMVKMCASPNPPACCRCGKGGDKSEVNINY